MNDVSGVIECKDVIAKLKHAPRSLGTISLNLNELMTYLVSEQCEMAQAKIKQLSKRLKILSDDLTELTKVEIEKDWGF